MTTKTGIGTIMVPSDTWTELTGGQIQVRQSTGQTVRVDCVETGDDRRAWWLPDLDEPTHWRVRLAPADSGEALRQPIRTDEVLADLHEPTLSVPRELPELIYVAGGAGPALRVYYPTSDRTPDDAATWAGDIGDRDLEILEALARVTLARIEEVRRGRQHQ